MPKPRLDFAIVEWGFIRFDPRYRALPDDEARAYLHLWVTCVHLRRETFSKAEIEGTYLPDVAGVTHGCFARMVASCLRSGLLSRGPRGVVSLDGIKAKHPTLRAWNDGRLLVDCCPPVSEEQEQEQDSTPPTPPSGGQSLRSEYETLRKRVQAKSVRAAVRLGDGFRFDVVRVAGKSITLSATGCENADPIVVGRRDIGLYRWE